MDDELAHEGGAKDPSASHDASEAQAEAERNAHHAGEEAERPFPIVGIGASAGGLEALRSLLDPIPADIGAAFVVVQHLDPDRESELATILQASTRLVVTQATEGQTVEPNTVYTIPPGKTLYLKHGRLHVEPQADLHRHHASITRFLQSLARDRAEQAVAVILSGAGGDGAEALRMIKERGGFVMVQDPEDAVFDSMPLQAIATRTADVVAPVHVLAGNLTTYCQGVGAPWSEGDADGLHADDVEALYHIFQILRDEAGHDFSDYKRPTILRRLQRHMSMHRLSDLSAYAEYLEAQPEEVGRLVGSFLISVTEFFRDPDAFAALERQVLPALFAMKEPGDQIRAWVPACATGEEAYSITMLLTEAARRSDTTVDIQIFASDIDNDALETARAGIYAEKAVSELSEARRRRFFVREPNGYRVRREIRETVLFTHHNVLRDPPFSRLDLVSCRNLLIYLNRDVQEQVLEAFHYALSPNGYLMLGSSENVDGVSHLFEPADTGERIYKRIPGVSSRARPGRRSVVAASTVRRGAPATREETLGDVHRAFMLNKYAPPSVVVDRMHQIRYFFGDVGKYLRPREGEPTYDILHFFRSSARAQLRFALFQVLEKGHTVLPRLMRVGPNNEYVNVQVEPLHNPAGEDALAVVTFEPAPQPAGRPDRTAEHEVADRESADEEATEQLEEELQSLRHRFQTVVEEYETTNEELNASNEELRSVNEELRSTTEELETQKEELQSANEELHTLNREYKASNEGLHRANDDLRNLMASTDIGTVFVDADLNLTRYTPRAVDLFNLIESDVGRPFEHITHKLVDYDPVPLLYQVKETAEPVEEEVRSKEGRHYLARALPYRSDDRHTEGVVVTFVDITARKQAEWARRRSEEQYQTALRNSPIIFARIDTDLRYQWVANVPDGWDPEAIIGKRDDELSADPGYQHLLQIKQRVLERCEQERHELTFARSDGIQRTFDVTITPLTQGDGTASGLITASLDITARKQAERALRESEETLSMAVEAGRLGVWSRNFIKNEMTFDAQARRLFGMDADMTFEEAMSRVHPDDAERVNAAIQQALDPASDGTYIVEHRLVQPDGSVRWLYVQGACVFEEVNSERVPVQLVGVAQDTTELHQAQEELRTLNETLEARVRERTEQLRKLASDLTLAEQRERRRVAHVLHDDLQQLLYAVQMKLAMAVDGASGANGHEADPHIQSMRRSHDLVTEAIQTTRRLTVDLSPPVLKGEGLPEAVRWLGDHIRETHGLTVHVQVESGAPRLVEDMRVLIFQLIRELLFNVVKHAQVSEVEVAIGTEEGQFVVHVRDQGQGFDPEAVLEQAPSEGSFGLASIVERLKPFEGTFQVQSGTAQGTHCTIMIPTDYIKTEKVDS